jgi:RecJ-like exonuclease
MEDFRLPDLGINPRGWWYLLKNTPLGDEGRGGRKVQCPKCNRYFYGETGLNNHRCEPVKDLSQPLNLEEEREMQQFLQGFMTQTPSGDTNCPACQGRGTIDEGDPCPICRGG